MKRTALLTALLGVFFFSNSCSSYDNMLEKFDSGLPASPERTFSITDSDFDEDEMLCDEYEVSRYGRLILNAPSGGTEYTWTIKISEGENQSSVEENVCNEQYFEYILPGVCIAGKINKLVLTVVDENGNKYTDKATILLN